jgi:carboxypeptidase family protein
MSVVPRTVVTGRILDAEGSPVGGCAVRVRSEAQPGWDWVASTGSDGSFRVEGVTLGKVHVIAQDIEAGSVESAMLEADRARGVVLVLDRTVELSGVVLDARGAPIARAAVKGTGQGAVPERIVIADEEGRFTLRGTPRGVERIVVWARGFEATTVTLGEAASAVKVDVRLRAAPPLRGYVVAPSGEPVIGARVSACAGNDVQVATSDAAGAFELPAAVIGCWVTASHARFADARATRIGRRSEIVVRLGAGGMIEGTAVDERGRPIGLFSVTIVSYEPEVSLPGMSTRVGETGEHLRGAFRLDDLAPGMYVLRLSAQGSVDTDSKPIEIKRGGVIRGEQFVLTAAEGEDGNQPESASEAESPEGTETATDTEEAESATP